MRKKMMAIVAAGVLGVSTAAVAGPALAAGTSSGTDTTVTSRVDRIKSALAGLVKDKELTQTQADEVATTLGSAARGRGMDHPGMDHPGMGGHHGRGGPQGPGMAAAAKALKMSDAELRTALQSGQSLAQVAKDRGVTVDTVVAALVAEAKTHIAQEVKAGRTTQVKADARLKELTARITERVNSARPARPTGEDRRSGPMGSSSSGPSGTTTRDSSTA